jgi:hypothetical protein
MQSWAAEELKYVQLGDERLNQRLIKMVETFAGNPECSVPQACKTWASTRASYIFWDNQKVKPEDIILAHKKSTVERIQEQEIQGNNTILAIQDTTNIDFTKHPKTKGLGHLDHPFTSGLKVHSCLTVSLDGVPQGIIYQKVWARDKKTKGKKHQRRKLETKDKESQRWLDTLKATEESIPEGIKVITVADREADIYDFFAMPRKEGSDLLIRVSYNRGVEDEAKYLWDAVRKSPILGQVDVEVGRKGDQPSRYATLNVSISHLSIKAPKNRKGNLPSIPVYIVLAEEVNPPVGVKPLCWLLLATFPVVNFADAIRCIQYYSYRWLIERYHFVLKSGCGVEKLQLEEASRIHRALATYCIVAWHLLWLTYEARYNPDLPCDRVLETHEWQSLYCSIHNTAIPPTKPPSIHDAVLWIAKLGGFLGRKCDGEPGVKTIWRGICSLHHISSTWKLAHSIRPTARLILVDT